jgi:hypothetical protein
MFVAKIDKCFGRILWCSAVISAETTTDSGLALDPANDVYVCQKTLN